MGSDGDFEFRRQELAHMTERPVDEITDEEVMQSYEDFLERLKRCWDIPCCKYVVEFSLVVNS